MDTKISFTHKDCGISFKLSPWDILHKYHKEYCPLCYYKKSKGEIRISNFLFKNNINFYREYTFQDLPKYRYDFYLPENNVCIEYDGK